MDSGKLPNYKSSYLLRFHPYPRVKPSARERVMATLEAADKDTYDEIFTPSLQSTDSDPDSPDGIKQSLDNVVYPIHPLDTFRRWPSLSSLVVDLALCMARKRSSSD